MSSRFKVRGSKWRGWNPPAKSSGLDRPGRGFFRSFHACGRGAFLLKTGSEAAEIFPPDGHRLCPSSLSKLLMVRQQHRTGICVFSTGLRPSAYQMLCTRPKDPQSVVPVQISPACFSVRNKTKTALYRVFLRETRCKPTTQNPSNVSLNAPKL